MSGLGVVVVEGILGEYIWYGIRMELYEMALEEICSMEISLVVIQSI